MATTIQLRVYTDGASRSNPGHAACAYLVTDQEDRPVKMYSEYLGPRVTNNVAEYYGLIRALAFVTEFTSGSPALTTITIRSDSQLIVEQVNRRWKVRDEELKIICSQCQQHVHELLSRGHRVTLEHIRREENTKADWLCNEALDAVLR